MKVPAALIIMQLWLNNLLILIFVVRISILTAIVSFNTFRKLKKRRLDFKQFYLRQFVLSNFFFEMFHHQMEAKASNCSMSAASLKHPMSSKGYAIDRFLYPLKSKSITM